MVTDKTFQIKQSILQSVVQLLFPVLIRNFKCVSHWHPPRTSSEAPRLLNQVREKIRLKHYSIRTEQAYTDWVGAYFVY